MKNFEVIYRNPGHWDIYQGRRRIYRIRGNVGDYCVINCDSESIIDPFKTVHACMSYICDRLMDEGEYEEADNDKK